MRNLLLKLIRPVVYVTFLFAGHVCPLNLWAQDVSLESYLQDVMRSSEELKALDLDIQSLQLEIEAREIELSPTITVETLKFWDDRPSLSSSRQSKGTVTEAGLTKPFSTGTSLNLSSGLETSEFHTTPSDDQNLINWELGVSQSLWQNSFGHQTRLRRQRDQSELQSRLLLLIKEKQNTLIDFETLYWDIADRLQEVRIREDGLKRSRRILSWIEDRFERAAAEQVDLLQGQTLVASRELQLQLAQDSLQSAQARLKEKLSVYEDFNPDLDELNNERNLASLPVYARFAPKEPVLIDALQSKAQAEFLEAASKLESDKLKPALQVGYAYGQQGLDTSFSRARKEAFSSDNRYHEVGVIFSMPLDFISISKSRRSTRAAAKAELLRSVKSQRESVIQWDDLKRTVQDQKQRVQKAAELLRLQQEKSREEETRYEKGRTTVFQALTFEQEAAESELLLLQTLSQLRRTESRARIYVQNLGSAP